MVPRPEAAAVFAFLLCSLTYAAAAQTPTATLFVETRDTTGALVGEVAITLTNQATGIERRATTSPEGTVVLPLLPAGTYTAAAAKAGYKQPVVRDLKLDAGGKGTLELVLLPGPYEESVVVSADLTRVRAGNAAIGEVYDGRMLVMMPVENRDFLQFTYQSPGSAPPAPGSRLSTQGNTGVNVSGAREAANNYLLDGADNNDLFLNRLVVTPSLDAVQEFTLQQNTYDAGYGRNAGAQVNVVLKSGGSRVAGSLFEYFRHEALDARGVFDPRDEDAPLFRRHQFGGTIGGPIATIPSFYFASVEAIRTRAGETRVTNVPTLAERVGDFSASGIAIHDPFTGRPYDGNRIPASLIDPSGAAVMALFPEPNRGVAGQNFVSSPTGTRDGLQLTVKTDHHRWRDHPIFVRYSLAWDDRAEPFSGRGRNVPGFGTSLLDLGHNLAAGVAQSLSPRIFNELRIGWNRLRRENVAASRGTDGFAALGIRGPSLAEVDGGYPAFTLAGYETIGDDPDHPVARRTHTFHVSDSLSVERGRQQFKVGGELRHYRSDGFNHLFQRGQIAFTGAFTGSALGDLLLGYPTLSLLAANDNPQALRTTAVNLFAQHDWRPTGRLTISAGVRYERNQPPVDANDRMRIFDAETLTLRPVGQHGVPRSGVPGDNDNVAPRVSASWQVPGSTGMVIRGGYGIYYDSGTLIENSALYFNPPYFDLRIFVPTGRTPLRLRDPFPSSQGFRPLPSVNTLARDFATALTHQGSVGLEARVRGVDYALRYVGSRGENLVRRRNRNQPRPGPGPLDERRDVPGFGDILVVEPEASSEYHALQLRADRQLTGGLSFRAAYTWSKSIDDASAFLQSEGNDNTPQDASRPELERGLSDFDLRHRLSLAAVWLLPDGESAWTRGWQASAILAVQSGRPFTPRVGFDNSNTGNTGGSFGYDRPNEIVNTGIADATVVRYGDRAFAVAPTYTFGNAGRNILIGPGYASLDVAIAKAFRLGGSRRLEARLEIYNALDRENLGLPDSFVDRPTFGQSLTAYPPRQIQLVGRFAF